MTNATYNPFFAGETNGNKYYYQSAEDRIKRVRHFDQKQCLAVMALPGIQKTVIQATERRLRQLKKGLK